LKLVWSRQAIEDRRAIFRYIEQRDPRAAVRISLRIGEACSRLPQFPKIGRNGRVEGTRELVITGTPYIAPYVVGAGEIRILRVLHSSRQWPRGFDEQT
jgi:toxin ParE1/3/4